MYLMYVLTYVQASFKKTVEIVGLKSTKFKSKDIDNQFLKDLGFVESTRPKVKIIVSIGFSYQLS